MRLKNAFRFALYGVFALLFVSGAAWIYADQMKNNTEMDTEMWQQAAAFLLSMHGGAAMITLMLLGALGPMHVQRAWRAKKNRVTGVASIAMYGLLIATAFGLAVPAVITAHIMVGRASVAATAQQARPQRATAATLVPDDTPADAVLVEIMSKAS